MGTILVKEAVWRVSTLLHDVAPQFARWPEIEIVQWLNDAQLAITKFLPSACSRVDAIKLQAGTLQRIDNIPAANCKPGDGSSPSAPILGTMLLDVLCNMGSDGVTPGKAIRLLQDGREVLDTQNPDWHTQTAASSSLYVFDPRTPKYFHVFPGVSGAALRWVRVAYAAQPIKIPDGGAAGSELYAYGGSNTTVISVSDDHIDDLVNYVCARAFMKNAQFAGNGPNAQAYTALFTGSLNAKVTAITGNNPNLKQLPFAPEPIGAAR